MTPVQEVLQATVESADVGTMTVKNYLILLLETLWEEKDGFSGKRPFGSSGWEFDLYAALMRAGLVDGGYDDSYIEILDRDTCDRLIRQAIESL